MKMITLVIVVSNDPFSMESSHSKRTFGWNVLLKADEAKEQSTLPKTKHFPDRLSANVYGIGPSGLYLERSLMAANPNGFPRVIDYCPRSLIPSAFPLLIGNLQIALIML